jgi:S1-C subfamily serine protease
VRNSPFQVLRNQIKNSAVLNGVDRMMPEQTNTWFSSFRGFVAKSEFPQVFGGLGGESIVDVPPPDESVLSTAQLRAARRSVVKIEGTAPDCSRRIEGSGFLYAHQRVMTNAHVVAGVREPEVFTVNGQSYQAHVVLYNPKRDIAVLQVPGLSVPALSFDNTAQTRDTAVVAGFPRNRPFTPVAAQIRAKQEARAPDIYHETLVTREIYAIRGTVEPGNSGGPLLAPNGKVYGVIFAVAVDDKQTGYALTADEVAPDARDGANAATEVSTGVCNE